MKRLHKILSFTALVALFSSCTLMLDEPEIKNDDVKSGDGWSSPIIEENDLYTMKKQYQPNTVYIGEDYLPFVTSFEEDSADEGQKNAVIYFSKKIPKSMLPQSQACVASDLIDEFNGGLCHKVDYVEETSTGYMVKLSRVPASLVYKVFDFESDGFIVEENGGNDPASRSSRCRVVSIKEYLEKTTRFENPLSSDDESTAEDGEFSLLNVNVVIDQTTTDFAYQYKNKNLVKKLNEAVNNWEEIIKGLDKGSAKKIISVYGEIDGKAILQAGIFMRYHIKLNVSDDLLEFWLSPVVKAYAGIGITAAKGGVFLPLIGGSSSMTVKDSQGSLHTVDKYLIKTVPFPPVAIGTTGVFFTYGFSSAIDLWGEVEVPAGQACTAGIGYEKVLARVGIDKQPGQGVKAIMEGASAGKTFTEASIPDRLNLKLGITWANRLFLGLQALKVVNLEFGVDPFVTLSYNYKIKDPAIKTPVLSATTGREFDVCSCDNEFLNVKAGLNADVRGYLDFLVSDVELFSGELFDEPFAFSMSKYSYPTFEEPVVLLTKADDANCYYEAKVKPAREGLFSTTVPKLAIYDAETMKFIKTVDCSNYENDKTVESNDVYEYKFSLPVLGESGQVEATQFYAMPYQMSSAVNRAVRGSNPSVFSLVGQYAKISNVKNIDYSDIDQEYYEKYNKQRYTYGSTFDVKISSTKPEAELGMLATIVDNATGKELARSQMTLEKYAKDASKKYYFYFFSNSMNMSGYKVKLSFYIIDKDGTQTYLDYKTSLFVSYGEGIPFEDIDFGEYDKWAFKN